MHGVLIKGHVLISGGVLIEGLLATIRQRTTNRKVAWHGMVWGREGGVGELELLAKLYLHVHQHGNVNLYWLWLTLDNVLLYALYKHGSHMIQ